MQKVMITLALVGLALGIDLLQSRSYAQECPPGSHLSYCEQVGNQRICHCVQDR
jgi:hypothetical protein